MAVIEATQPSFRDESAHSEAMKRSDKKKRKRITRRSCRAYISPCLLYFSYDWLPAVNEQCQTEQHEDVRGKPETRCHHNSFSPGKWVARGRP